MGIKDEILSSKRKTISAWIMGITAILVVMISFFVFPRLDEQPIALSEKFVMEYYADKLAFFQDPCGLVLSEQEKACNEQREKHIGSYPNASSGSHRYLTYRDNSEVLVDEDNYKVIRVEIELLLERKTESGWRSQNKEPRVAEVALVNKGFCCKKIRCLKIYNIQAC